MASKHNMQYKGILHLDGQKFIISRDSNKVGSLRPCNIHLQHPSISKIHVRIDWTKVGLVITNMTSFGKTFINNVPLKPLEAKAIKHTETSVKFGELEGHLVLHKDARKIARKSLKELQQVHQDLECSKCRKCRDVEIRATLDERRKFRLKFVMPRKDRIGGILCSKKTTIDRSLYDNFSHLSLTPTATC